MKYIPADKLIAKIAELRKELPDTIENLNDEESGFARGQQYELTALEAEISCLQQEQPEVDLEKEFEDYLGNVEGQPRMWHPDEQIEWAKDVARHFYELGLKSRNDVAGVELIAAERKRQIEGEGWTKEHDAEHTNDALALAAVCYAIPSVLRSYTYSTIDKAWIPKFWPWCIQSWKPSPENRVKELVKAGALIAAEIDRLNARKEE